MIEAVIFDMDGLIIDSEPLWRKAEIAIFKEVSVFLSEADCESTAGLRIDEVVEHWFRLKPWDQEKGCTKKEIEYKIVDRLIELIYLEGKPLPGIPEIFDEFRQASIPMVIASSSNYRIIEAVTEKLKITHYFKFVYSAEDEEYGKPHPGIFITAAKKLGVHPSCCLVFEDSFNGLLAALSARTKVVVVPERDNYSKAKFDIAHLKLKSLREFSPVLLNQTFNKSFSS